MSGSIPNNFTQDFFTSYREYNDGDTRLGQLNRLWYDSTTNTIRVSDGVTPGGIIVSSGSSSSISYPDQSRSEEHTSELQSH